jgi:hypothetical protein
MIAEVIPQGSPIPEEYRGLEQEVSALEVRVSSLQILSEPDHEAACALEQQLAERDTAIVARLAPAKTAAHRAHKEICDLETMLRGPIVKARPALKQKIGAWRQQQRVEAERLAQVARDAARRQAEEETLARAQAFQDRGEGERAEAVISTFQAPAVVVATPKPASYGTRAPEVWRAEIEDKLKLIAWVAEKASERHVYLDANLSALSGQAKLFKLSLSIPGVRAASRFS